MLVFDTLEDRFDSALEHAREVLPAQGPIGNFVHHNTLHAYQHLPFHEALAQAGAMHDAQVYLREDQYHAALATGAVRPADLEYALAARHAQIADDACGTLRRHALEHVLLVQALPMFERARSSDADLALYDLATRIAPAEPAFGAELLNRLGRDRTQRDLLIELGARDPSQLSNPVLIDFLCAYLDEGMARWPMPGRERGILRCFHAYLSAAPSALPAFLRNVLARLQAAALTQAGPRTLCLSLLRELCVDPYALAGYLSRSLLVLPGWSGMVARLEHTPGDRGPDAPPASLCELTALRLLLDVETFQQCARELGYAGSTTEFRGWASVQLAQLPAAGRNAQALFGLAKLGVLELSALGQAELTQVCGWLAEFSAPQRLPILHEAYERAHMRSILDPLAHKRELIRDARAQGAGPSRLQVMFCIDDREESIRRYFEELDPQHTTYGVAGFFGVAMSFRGIDDADASALCPVVITPGHHIEEAPLPAGASAFARRSSRRNFAARVRFELAEASRSLVRGALFTSGLGVLAAIPLTMRVLFPHASARLTRWLHARALPAPQTELVVALDSQAPAGPDAAKQLGFSASEQADRVAATLQNVGATRNFARLVTLLGHGASSVNNPHHSAYDCGACGGRNGGPNARAFASMANAPGVRALLRERGIDIPDDTWFIGGAHDTTTDEIRLFDLERVPASHAQDLTQLRAALDHARTMSAYERCRKFEHAPAKLTPASALRHVEERAVDLSQARPELGHATNAICVVGRRDLTRDLFLDRRAFLVSYDASIDGELKFLQRILAAVVPVGAGINLEYYFSTVDNNVWGAGTKLPHNLAGLLGVMEGSRGDLRTGLPRQMIEVHDPVRLLCVIEAAPEAIMEIAAREAEVAELVSHEWVRVVSVQPETGALAVFERGAFRPYAPGDSALQTVSDAADWYRGKLGFLSPVLIAKARDHAA